MNLGQSPALNCARILLPIEQMGKQRRDETLHCAIYELESGEMKLR